MSDACKAIFKRIVAHHNLQYSFVSKSFVPPWRRGGKEIASFRYDSVNTVEVANLYNLSLYNQDSNDVSLRM